MIELTYLLRIGVAVLLSSLIGMEREHNDKPYGFRTIILITLGATLITIFSLRYVELTKEIGVKFDAIRAIAYYLMAVGFGTSLIKRTGKGKFEGATTMATILPLCSVGFFCGIGDYFLAIVSSLIIYSVLKFKYVKIKIKRKRRKKRGHK